MNSSVVISATANLSTQSSRVGRSMLSSILLRRVTSTDRFLIRRPFVTTNVNGTLTLLDSCRQHEIPRFLQVSTDEVYGSLGDEGFFTEDTPLAPNSPYSASKTSADLLVRAYSPYFQFSWADYTLFQQLRAVSVS